MNFPHGNEYRWTLALFLATGALACVLLLARVLPLRRANAALHDQRLALEQELAPYQSRNALDPLADQVRRQQNAHQRLQQEWVRLMALRDTFQGASPFEQVLPSSEEGRIDFKVALYNARNVLLARAQERGLQIPPGLGMEEAIGTDEPAETRIWQLASIVRLVELGVGIGIPRIELLQPLPPVSHPGRLPDGQSLREFPIRMVFCGAYPHLLEFLARIQQPRGYFAVQRFRAESLSTADPFRLRVEVVCCAGLLRTEPFPRTEAPGFGAATLDDHGDLDAPLQGAAAAAPEVLP